MKPVPDHNSDLIVGGSGMLGGLSVQLATQNRQVFVLARNREKLELLANKAKPANLHPLVCDYRDRNALDVVFDSAPSPKFDRIICWSHDIADFDIPAYFAQFAAKRFVHIVGSAAANPAQPDMLDDMCREFSAHHPGIVYQIVVLGFSILSGASRARWLTHDEICCGVMDALNHQEKTHIVGQVSPWSRRP